jgi:hypothetical protein
MLCTFERKILKIVHGPIQDKEQWRPRWNGEVYNLYKDLNILDDIKNRRLGWAGHFVMEDEKIPKQTLNVKFNNTKPWGKSTRWKDVMRRHITDSRNTRVEETSRRQRRIEVSSEGGQGPEGAVSTKVK